MAKLILSPLFLCTVVIALTSCSNVTVKTDDNFEVIELPDNSEVYLNHNSSIKYDESFNPRHIELSGEAFFSIHPGEVPFVVTTSLGKIKVLGTEFNVKANQEELEVEVEEGYVELKTQQHNNKLKRGEYAIFSKSKNTVQKGKAKFKFRVWMNDLKSEFKKLGKELRRGGKRIGKELKKMEMEIKKDLK